MLGFFGAAAVSGTFVVIWILSE
ncbi:Protein of unknown function [Bacillus mycoides]|nr:Protein of unknown function [Bacillus mycoides]